ncbi:MAG: hypothetical protein GJT30_09220 [Geobacter sp.]|nr:hypothetical protein [Geobacter sp.]
MNIAVKTWTALRVFVVIASACFRKGNTLQIGDNRDSVAFCYDLRPVTPAELKLILATPDAFLDKKRRLLLTIIDCPLLLAPLLLFYLKRHGFSRCRVWREPAGMTFTAAR